jgi:hypothetical protein
LKRFIPLMLLPMFIGSGIGLWLYGDVSEEDRAKADAIAADYAARLYRKALSELSRSEAQHVQALTRKHFAA